MTPVSALSSYFRKYTDFTGRAARSEYWWMALWQAVFYVPVLVVFAFNISPRSSDAGPLLVPIGWLLFLAFFGTLIPNVSLLVRRLHDANLAGGYAFLGLIPSLGGIAILVFSLLPSNPLGVRFDTDTAAAPRAPSWRSERPLN